MYTLEINSHQLLGNVQNMFRVFTYIQQENSVFLLADTFRLSSELSFLISGSNITINHFEFGRSTLEREMPRKKNIRFAAEQWEGVDMKIT